MYFPQVTKINGCIPRTGSCTQMHPILHPHPTFCGEGDPTRRCSLALALPYATTCLPRCMENTGLVGGSALWAEGEGDWRGSTGGVAGCLLCSVVRCLGLADACPCHIFSKGPPYHCLTSQSPPPHTSSIAPGDAATYAVLYRGLNGGEGGGIPIPDSVPPSSNFLAPEANDGGGADSAVGAIVGGVAGTQGKLSCCGVQM